MARGKDLSDFERVLIVGIQIAGASITNTAQLAGISIGTVTKGQTEEQLFLRRLRMSMQDVIRLCQQEQSVNNYIERDIIVELQCINPSLQR